HAMVAASELVEVADVKALVPVAIQGEQVLHLGDGRPLGRRRAAAAIKEAVIAVVLEAPAEAANATFTAPENRSDLGPGQLPGNAAQNHLLGFHGTLHSAGRIGHRHLPGAYSFHAVRQERSFHDSLGSGHFTYLQQRAARALDGAPAIV